LTQYDLICSAVRRRNRCFEKPYNATSLLNKIYFSPFTEETAGDIRPLEFVLRKGHEPEGAVLWMLLSMIAADGIMTRPQREYSGRNMANKISQEKREYVRALISTNAKIARIDPKQMTRLPKQGAEMVPENLGVDRKSETDVEQGFSRWANQFAQCLQRIDEKLDRILEKLECERSDVSPTMDATIKDISGSGMGLVLSEPLETGQLLQISMSLPGFPLNSFQAYGKVVRISARSGKDKGLFDVAVKFLQISETDREHLIAYSFSAQRKAIRTVNETASI
jgi:hypothetical protein